MREPDWITAEEMIRRLRTLDPDTVLLLQDGLGWVSFRMSPIASTEHGLEPKGRKKVGIMRRVG